MLCPLVPAKAGTQGHKGRFWIPAFAGMSGGEIRAEWHIGVAAYFGGCIAAFARSAIAGGME